MPQGMSKRIFNKTVYNKQKDTIHWSVHIVFVINTKFNKQDLFRSDLDNPNQEQLTVVTDSLVTIRLKPTDENTSIQDILNSFLDPSMVRICEQLMDGLIDWCMNGL